MSGYMFIASSKELVLPEEIMRYNEAGIFNERGNYLNVWQLTEQDEGERQALEKIMTMPYLYYIAGIGNADFWRYLDEHMEVGDVLEIVNIHIQHRALEIVEKMLEHPSPIFINIGSKTFQNATGTYQLSRKHWIEELTHRTLVTDFGMTTIVKY